MLIAEEPHYIVKWTTLTAKILRPNLNCTNGYVHVIDRVLMSRGDVVVNQMRDAAGTMKPNVLTAMTIAVLSSVTRMLYVFSRGNNIQIQVT